MGRRRSRGKKDRIPDGGARGTLGNNRGSEGGGKEEERLGEHTKWHEMMVVERKELYMRIYTVSNWTVGSPNSATRIRASRTV